MDSSKRLYWFIKLFVRCGGWVALIPLLIGVASTLGSITLGQHAKQLADLGVPATAIVTAKRISKSNPPSSSRQQPSTQYYISLTFTPQKGQKINAEHRVNLDFYNHNAIGQSFSIRYLPDNPEIHELYKGQLEGQSKATQIVGLAFAILGFGACIWFAKTALRALKARENVGIIIEAPVTLRSIWPPVFNKMHYQVGEGATTRTHKTFVRPIWAYRGLKRGSKTRVAITSEGPYWANDLFL